MTSIWWSTQLLMNWSMVSVRGTPSTRASMLALKLVCSSVCLSRLFSTTRATASRLRTTTNRWPVRPEEAAAAAVVAHVGDALPPAGVGELGDLQREIVGVDHVGQLGDRDAGAALVVLVDLEHGALGDRAAAGSVGLLDALAAHDQRTVGEVGTLDPLDERVLELLAGGVGVLERPPGTLGYLAQVVR